MRFLIRVLVVFVIVMAALSALRGLFASSHRQSASGENGPTPGKTGRLLRDPICGTYVPREGSLNATRRSEIFYFCSEECRDEFIATGT